MSELTGDGTVRMNLSAADENKTVHVWGLRWQDVHSSEKLLGPGFLAISLFTTKDKNCRKTFASE